MHCQHCTFLNSANAKICEMCSKTLQVSEDFLCPVVECKNLFNCTEDQCHCSMPNPNVVQYCELCNGSFDAKDFFAMMDCTHIFCKECAAGYFTVQITERTILDCNCPMCDLPDLQKISEEESASYFSLLSEMLKVILDENIFNLFEKKLTERALVSLPGFIWCIRCTSGFVADRFNLHRARCPDCFVNFCVQCRIVWEPQHKDISCEQFAQWKIDNDPKHSNELISKRLEDNGIVCPKCKFKYDLTRGGCIHFTCRLCKYEFCFGCSQPFQYSRKCPLSYCDKFGLHSHHHRNCCYYLRDKGVADLQDLLRVNNITFTTEGSVNEARSCPMELQHKNGKDDVCGFLSEPAYGGLCEQHYVEYLMALIRKNNLETTSILTIVNLIELLQSNGIDVPAETSCLDSVEYKMKLTKLVKDKIPLV